MAQKASGGALASLSTELAGVVEAAGPSVVRVDDGSRLTATGIVWAEDGVIVTTSHGVERDEDLAIEMADGARHAAALVGRDPDTDLAALRVDVKRLKAAAKAGGEDARVGHIVLALGRPGASGLQATIGIVSARHETQTNGRPGYVLSTDAVLYPGFSGGPLVDVSGRVVGLNNLMFGRGKGVAIGTPVVSEVVDGLLKHGRIRRGYLGVRSQVVTLPEALRASLKLDQEQGVLIVQVEPGSPAEQGGLLLGDTLLAIKAQAVADVDTLRSALRGLSAGDAAEIQILRGGALASLNVTLGAEP